MLASSGKLFELANTLRRVCEHLGNSLVRANDSGAVRNVAEPLRYATELLRYVAEATTIRSELLRHVAYGHYDNDNVNVNVK